MMENPRTLVMMCVTLLSVILTASEQPPLPMADTTSTQSDTNVATELSEKSAKTAQTTALEDVRVPKHKSTEVTETEMKVWEARQGQLNKAEIKRLAIMSGAAYCYDRSGEFDLQDWKLAAACNNAFPRFTTHEVFHDKRTHAAAFIGVDKANRAVVLSVKGTTSTDFRDIQTDLADLLTFDKDCLVGDQSLHIHSGFCASYSALKRQGVSAKLLALHKAYPRFKMILTGHSLGAAIASLFGFEMIDAHKIPASVITYGQPRTGTSVFAEKYAQAILKLSKATYFRVHGKLDLVPHMPACYGVARGLCVRDDKHPYHAGIGIVLSDDDQGWNACHPLDGSSDCHSKPFWEFRKEYHTDFFDQNICKMCCPAGKSTHNDNTDAMRIGTARNVGSIHPATPDSIPVLLCACLVAVALVVLIGGGVFMLRTRGLRKQQNRRVECASEQPYDRF